MSVIESLEKIRPLWLTQVSMHFARAERVREKFLEQIRVFYDLVIEAVNQGDAAVLDPLLNEWAHARTETELEQEDASSLPPIISQFLLSCFQAANQVLPESSSLELMDAVLPVFTHALEITAVQETQLHVQHIREELGEVQETLERLEKSKSDFISVAAHELKTPLTLIEGYASMLQDSLLQVKNGIPMADIYLEGVRAGNRRLREIVDDMIDVSLIDNDMLALSYQPVWLSHLMSSISHDLEDITRQRSLNLDINAFPGSREMIFGDGERLYQAIKNIISNAIKYTPDGGKIQVDGRLLPGFIEITVADTGIGIDPEDHYRIFEKFGRVGNVSLHSSGKTKFKGGGPGLGLPIAKGIIDAHGGTIWVESSGYDETNCPGSIFHIMLPIMKAPPDDKSGKLFRQLVSNG